MKFSAIDTKILQSGLLFDLYTEDSGVYSQQNMLISRKR